MLIEKIGSDQENTRLDKFLCKKFDISFAIAQKLIRQNKIKINGKKTQINQKLNANDEIIIFSDLEKRVEKSPRKPSLSQNKIATLKNSIIFTDKNLIILNKPSGLATQGGSGVETSVDDFLPYLNSNKDEELPKLVHRLDKDTSGILLIAKNKTTAEYFFEKFKNREISKTYLALIKGVTNKSEGKIDIPLKKKFAGKNEKVYQDRIDGKEAITNYQILKRFKDFSLIELKPLTGRTHQLRVHCKEIGHPIINDFKYGGKSTNSQNLGSRLCLHAYKIEIEDYFGQKLTIKTKLPDFLQNLIPDNLD